MLRRPSAAESTSSSGGDVNFDDVNDSQFFAYMDDAEEQGSGKNSASRNVDFRLDFSSRVNPAPLPPDPVPILHPSPTMSRRSSTSSMGSQSRHSSAHNTPSGRLQRSPSLRSTTIPFRKRLSRRPSETSADAISPSTVAKTSSVRPESPPVSPASSPVFSHDPIPSSVGPAMTPPHQPKSPLSPTARSSSSQTLDQGQFAAAAHAAVALETALAENEALRSELVASRLAASELQQRVKTAESQHETLTHQLLSIQNAHEHKLQTLCDEFAAERATLSRLRASECAELREAHDKDLEALQEEVRAAISVMKEEKNRLQSALLSETERVNTWRSKCAALQAELVSVNSEKQDRSQADAQRMSKCDELQAAADHWEGQCQSLQDQVHQLLHEHECTRQQALQDREEYEKKSALHKAVHERFMLQVQLLQGQLKSLATETRETIRKEMTRSTLLLSKLQQQASEITIQQNDRAMALASKQNRIIQLETQLKNERQCVAQLDLSVAKATRALEKKEALFKSKYHEQKEFLDITVAVRDGLTNELQTKRRRLEELEAQILELQRSKEGVEKKNRYLTQQVKIMQQIHAREMEEVLRQKQTQADPRHQSYTRSTKATARPTTKRTSVTLRASATATDSSTLTGKKPVSTLMRRVAAREETSHEREKDEMESTVERQTLLPEDDEFATEEWREFVALAAVHEAECRHYWHQATGSPV